MAVPDRTIDVRHRPEPPLRVALTGWYDPDSVSFDARAHEAARKSVVVRRPERDAGPTVMERT